MSNNFLGSNVSLSDISTETTLQKVSDTLQGTIDVNIVGAGSNTVLTDVAFATTQTDDLNVSTNVEFLTDDTIDGTSLGVLMMAKDEEKAGDIAKPIIVDDNGDLKVIYSNSQIGDRHNPNYNWVNIEDDYWSPFTEKFSDFQGNNIVDATNRYTVETSSTDYQITRTKKKFRLQANAITQITIFANLDYEQSGVNALDYQKIGIWSDDPTNATDLPTTAIWFHGNRSHTNPDDWRCDFINNGLKSNTPDVVGDLPSTNTFTGFRIEIINYATPVINYYIYGSSPDDGWTLATSHSIAIFDVFRNKDFYIGNVSSASSANIATSILYNYDVRVNVSTEDDADAINEVNVNKRHDIFNEHYTDIADSEDLDLIPDLADYLGFDIHDGGSSLMESIVKTIKLRSKYLVFETRASFDLLSAQPVGAQIKLFLNSNPETGATSSYHMRLETDTGLLQTDVVQIAGGGTNHKVSSTDFRYDILDGNGESGIDITVLDVKHTFRIIMELSTSYIAFQIYSPLKNHYVTFNDYTLDDLTNKDQNFQPNEVQIAYLHQDAGQHMYVDGYKLYSTDDDAELNLPHKEQAFVNNNAHLYLRTRQNDGTTVRVHGGTFGITSTALRQCTYGLAVSEFLTQPFDQLNDDIQISCTRVAATSQTVLVSANQVDGTAISAVVALNGQTAVNIVFAGGVGVYRITAIQVLTNTMDGTTGYAIGGEVDVIYVSPQGQTLTLGVPDDNIWGTCALGLGSSKLGYLHVIPNKNFIPISMVLLSNKASGRSCKFVFQAKPCNSELWTTFLNSGYSDDAYIQLNSAVSRSSGATGADVRILVSQGDGTGSLDDVGIILNAIQY